MDFTPQVSDRKLSPLQIVLILLAAMAVSSLITLFFIQRRVIKKSVVTEEKTLLNLVTHIRQILRNEKSCTQSFRDKILRNTSKEFDAVKGPSGRDEYKIGKKMTNSYEFSGMEVKHIDSISKSQGIFLLKISFKNTKVQDKKNNVITYRNIIYGDFNKKKRIESCHLGQIISL